MIVWVRGFWTKTCLPIFIAVMAMTAWLWSGVLTVMASRLFSFSSIFRKSRYLAAFSYFGLLLGHARSDAHELGHHVVVDVAEGDDVLGADGLDVR